MEEDTNSFYFLEELPLSSRWNLLSVIIRSLRVYIYHHECVWKHIDLATLEIPYEAKNHLNVQRIDIKGFEAVDIYTAYRDFVQVYNMHIDELNT
ncbi:unnamed protein product [Albugo candida]|uniref:Uncharacterized protein n=1 Tax=Albugo candida TaxID=65357 RepID=A0A024FUH5_9STRA|nr:unnamed protein product [Albugo candida]|eukprot:CCI10547.1 unnamed protein product [Albugo candida]